VSDSYSVFRNRWDQTLPELCGAVADFNFEKMRQSAVKFEERVPPMEIDHNVVELL
jgi:hypothetical protein